MAFFLIFITRWWLIIAGFYWLLGIATWVLMYLQLPESPLWLVMNNHTAEAVAVLNRIAEVNGVEERISIDTEFTDLQVKPNDD
jgi:hypothetical protein